MHGSWESFERPIPVLSKSCLCPLPLLDKRYPWLNVIFLEESPFAPPPRAVLAGAIGWESGADFCKPSKGSFLFLLALSKRGDEPFKPSNWFPFQGTNTELSLQPSSWAPEESAEPKRYPNSASRAPEKKFILRPLETCGFFNTKIKLETTIYKLQCAGV